MDTALLDVLAAGSAFLASAALGFTKKFTGALDGKIGTTVKPLQPLIVTAVGIGLPVLASALHLTTATPDASTFVTAPTATILAVTLREVAARIRKPA